MSTLDGNATARPEKTRAAVALLTPLLFPDGPLCDPAVPRANFGRTLPTRDDTPELAAAEVVA